MPHSESPATSPPIATPTSEEFDKMEQDAAAVKAETQPDETDGDITMAEMNPLQPGDEAKKDVKLEDLFADVDSDDEFPSEKPTQSQPLPTSSPNPSSPVPHE